MGLKKQMKERFCLSKYIPNIAWKEVVSGGDRTEADRMGNLRAQHTKVWGVSSIFLNSEMHFPDFYSGLGFKPKFSSLYHCC